ncbi:MAG: hypothetical protein RL670_1235 [Actinomycetota bacterium]
MSASVGAVVLARGHLAALDQTIGALQGQSRKPDFILVAHAESDSELAACLAKNKINAVATDTDWNSAIGAARETFSAWADDPGHFYWMLEAGDQPTPAALANLIAAAERSTSLGILAPKQMVADHPRIIREFGLTLTPWGGLFSPAAGALDQAQFDNETDVLAASSHGLLVRADVWSHLAGFDERFTPLAAQYDLSMRARLAGFRVDLIPAAKVSVPKPAEPLSEVRRKTELQLKFAFAPALLLPALWLALPLWTLIRVGYQIAFKRLDLLWPEVKVGFAAFVTGWRFFGLRRAYSLQSARQLRLLRATWAEVKANQAEPADFQAEIATARPDRPGTVAVNPWWLLALVAVNVAYWPTDSSAIGGALKPLSESWLRVFAHAGSGWQVQGFGSAVPADPVNWVLASLSMFTIWQPSLAIGLLLLTSRALAFWGVKRLSGRLGASNLMATFAALVYAFWPSLTNSLALGSLGAVIAAVAAPWLVASLLAVIDPARSKSSWQTQVGIAGLLLAVELAASPSTAVLWLLFGGFLAFRSGRNTLRLVWLVVPTVAIFAPYIWFMVAGFGHPLLVFIDPLAATSHAYTLWQAALGGAGFSGWLQPASWGMIAAAVATLLFALASASTKKPAAALFAALWLVATIYGWMLSHIEVINEAGAVNAEASLALAGLALVLGISTSHSTAKGLLGSFAFGLVVLPLAVSAAIGPTVVRYSNSQTLPAIVNAQWQQGEHQKVLQLSGEKLVTAELVTPESLTLDGQSLGYRLSAAMRQDSADAKALTNIAANLVAGSANDLTKPLADLGIGFVFAPNPTPKLVAALDSSSMLEAVGTTELGRLWRVPSANSTRIDSEPTTGQLWSITKAVQFLAILVFALMALPTARRRRKTRDTSLDESENVDVA